MVLSGTPALYRVKLLGFASVVGSCFHYVEVVINLRKVTTDLSVLASNIFWWPFACRHGANDRDCIMP